MMRRSRKQGGSTVVEFTLVGIPMMFLLISTFEIGRGMWTYQTVSFGVKEGARYASVHGQTCATAPNTCSVTVAQVVQKVLDSSPGLLSSSLNVTLTSPGGAVSCAPATSCIGTNANNAVWPPAPNNGAGNDIEIDVTYPFQSALSMFWPGAAGSGVTFRTVNFPASSKESMKN
jgi:Flp pilus assembly protein TadG